MNAPTAIRMPAAHAVRALPPIGPTLGDLLDYHQRLSSEWSAANDGLTFDIADQIKDRLKAGGNGPLTEAQADYLTGTIL